MKKQSMTFLPTTKPGWWSLGLILAMPVLIIIGSSLTNLFYSSIPAGGTILADIAARPALAITSLAGMVAGIFAFLLGIAAIVQKKERALLVIVSSLIGALLLLFLAGEVISPH